MPSRLLQAILVSLVVFAAACSIPTAPDREPTVAAPAPSPSGIASALVDLTNVERRNGGLADVRANARLMQAAQLQADQVASSRLLEHVLPDAPYPAPADRLAAAGYPIFVTKTADGAIVRAIVAITPSLSIRGCRIDDVV